MFDVALADNGVLRFIGRLDAAQAAKAQAALDAAADPGVVDFALLEYISSAGLGVLLKTQKRLMASGRKLKLVNVNHHIHDVFRYSGFDQIFEIERAAGPPGP